MTLEEIAKMAGVSRSTVSRVINNQPRVSAETRQRVLSIIRQHGYHPNIAARTLAGQRSRTIGAVIPSGMNNIATPYYALIMQGVTTACDQRNYNLMLFPRTIRAPDGYARLIRGGLVEGLLVTTSSVGETFLAWLSQQDFPFVLIGRQHNIADINTVSADNYRGGAMAAQHLLWLGYERIAIITGPRQHGVAVDRREGFLSALVEAGVPCPPQYVVEGDFSEHSGYQAMKQLLITDPRPQAVFCSADLMAIGAMRAIHEAGLHIPTDIAVVGFDDIPMASSIDPPLTTVRQPIEQMGYMATSMLIDIVETSTDDHRRLAPQHVILPTELVVRQSCGQQRRFAMRMIASEEG